MLTRAKRMTPRKRRVLLLGLAALACVIYLLRDRSAINQANFERIQVGMTLAEVEAILGGPLSRGNGSRPESYPKPLERLPIQLDPKPRLVWHGQVSLGIRTER